MKHQNIRNKNQHRRTQPLYQAGKMQMIKQSQQANIFKFQTSWIKLFHVVKKHRFDIAFKE